MRTDEKVAVKIIRNLFSDINVAKHTLREVRLLHHFDHENVSIDKTYIEKLTKERKGRRCI